MIFLGVDPGLKGGLALYDGRALEVYDMPVMKVTRNEVDAARLAKLLSEYEIDEAWVELVNAAPLRGRPMGTASMFNFGEGFGIIKGVLAARGIPINLVTPAVWKKALKVPVDKDAARGRATQLFPAQAQWPKVRHDGRAEAAMIALYGFRRSTNAITEPETW